MLIGEELAIKKGIGGDGANAAIDVSELIKYFNKNGNINSSYVWRSIMLILNK